MFFKHTFKSATADDTPHATEEELVKQYQKHFDKDLAMRLLVKLRKSPRGKLAPPLRASFSQSYSTHGITCSGGHHT